MSRNNAQQLALPYITPVQNLDASNKIQSYTQLKIEKPYIVLNDETYISIHSHGLNTCKKWL